MQLKKLIFCAVAVALIGVCAWVQIPFAVPFTLQTFGICCALLILGGKGGTVAVLVYLCTGAVGLPVFSGFGGGIGKLLGPTGGYLLGFLPMCLFYWALEKQLPPWLLLAVGTLLCYACGTLWFSHVYAVTLWAALAKCVVPFLLPDGLKIALALAVAPRIRKALS